MGAGLGSLVGAVGGVAAAGGAATLGKRKDPKYNFMYRRPILCTLYGAVDFLNVLKKYIMHYVPIGAGDM